MNFDGGTLNYNEYELGPGDSLKLKGTIDSAGEKLLTINYNDLTYNIPILVSPKTGITAPVTPTEEMPSDAIKFIDNPNEINVSVLDGQMLTGSINFKNFWTKDVKDVKLSLSDNLGEVLTLDKTSFDVINPNQVDSVSVQINTNKNMKKDYSGDIKLTYGTNIISYSVLLTYIASKVSKEASTQPIAEAQVQQVETEQQEIQKQNQLQLGFFISLLTILFVLFIVILVILRSRKKKPKDFIFSSRR